MAAAVAFLGFATQGPGTGTRSAEAQSRGEQANRRSAEDSAHPTRVYADAFLVWIYGAPERDPAPIGYLRGGQSTELRSHEGRPKHERVRRGCGNGWVAVEPAGFVCLDGSVSLSPNRYTESMAGLAPDDGPYLFEYALSMGTPSYRRLPTDVEASRKERLFGSPQVRALPPHWRGHEELVGAPLPRPDPVPDFLRDGGSVARGPENRLSRRDVPFGSMLAITQSLEHDGRVYLQSADGTVVPADRMRMFRRSTFQGVELGREFSLPLAWPKRGARVFSLENSCKKDLPSGAPSRKSGELDTAPAKLASSCMSGSGREAAERVPLNLSGRTLRVEETTFAEISGQQGFLALSSAYIAERKSIPHHLRTAGGQAARWLHFRIGQGTLVSYEGEQPAFATLASPGIGGVPPEGADPLATRTTPVGLFRIQFKHRSDDMSPESGEHRKFWIADVPYAQYFQQPFAIHVAYWHESFGEPMSGGCINVSPRDGARLFSFTAPHLPPNWYGVGASKAFGLGTSLLIER